MPSEIESSVPSSEPVASRRKFVAAVTVAAAVGTAGPRRRKRRRTRCGIQTLTA
jgi:hypothetical protein